MLTDDELMWAMWVARVLGDLLAAAPQITCRQERGHLAEIFRLCIDSVSSRNVSVFARLMHVDPETARNWQNGKRIPQLPFLLSMAYRLGISLLDLLLESPALVSPKFVRAAPVEVEVRTKRPTMQHGRRISRAEVSGILNTALNEIPPPSAKQVMGRLIYGEATIYRHFPELRRQIAQRYAEYRRKRAIARKAQAAEEVKRAAYKLHATGISLTYRHISPLLTSSAYLNLKEAQTALREIRRQLAHRPGNGP